ncbi:hypothetical protein [Leucobacter aridicollis]|uniref:hypothetical protein n=1 Tax=Leucobacter aridicollis TaxID=283878 RepID=UPI0021027172|nr:hypothetical protein [Leucobacter aridicollis]UTX52018.1 hypothetical protein KI794_09555 [Leucobacter aridicollis]
MNAAQELHNIRHMPYGTARTAAAEAAARKIEADGPQEHLAEALLDLVEAYTFGGEGAKSFVVFARALRHWDASPELFDASDEHNLFWEFKWVASDLPDFPQITAAQAEAFLDDMQRRFELQGSGISAVLAARFGWAWQSGATDAEQRRLAWISSPRDDFDDCHACVIGRQTDFFMEQGRFAEAFELGRTQDGKCNIEPAKTFHATALAALNLGQPAESLNFYNRATASDTRANRDLASSRGQSFELLARGGHFERALRELRGDYRDMLTDPPSPLQHLRFLLGLLAGLSANLDSGEQSTGISLPGVGQQGRDMTVAELHAWAVGKSSGYASAFDARSGTTYYADLVERALTAERATSPLDFGPAYGGAGEPAVQAVPTNSVAPVATPDAPPQRSGLARLWSKLTDSGTSVHEPEAAPDAAIGPDSLLARAEEAAARKDYSAATRDYAEAITPLETAGWLERAGLAAAEAAQCATLDRNEERAHALFGRALPLLRSGGADAGTLAAILAAWAPVADRMNDAEAQIRATAAALAAHPELDRAGLTEELAEKRAQEWGVERATLRDTLARSLAATRGRSFGDGLDSERAASEALRAGEEFAQLGMLADASHAFWLAGKIHRDRGDTEAAVWGLESAFEGFSAAKKRKERLLAAGELIALLKETGQQDRASAIVAQL